ncbi:hypothetical protein DXG01_003496 [Tephrocybe rancida]|nr:hypothetical protein DXG01_003496 [Tephrocybe rancida]
MSFQDIEAGVSHPQRSPSASSNPQDASFLSLQSSLSLQVFKMNANVQGILKLVDQLGTGKDSAALRKSLHDLTETTRAMAKRGSEDLKKLSALQASLPQQKTALQKTSHDLQLSVAAFQRAQQVSAERQRTVVQGVKLAVEDEHPSESPSEENPNVLRQAQILQQQLSPHELAYQESLIQEREAEIREIESGMHELAEIFRDLGTLVGEQGQMIDDISNNIFSVRDDTGAASQELTTAHEYQRKAGRRAACLMLVLAVVVAIVLLAATPSDFSLALPHLCAETMRKYLVLLAAFAGQLATAHYTFPDLYVNNTLSTDWQYVRITANHYTSGPVTDVTSSAIRCYELDSTAATSAGIATVTAGSTVGFKAGAIMGHPGYFSAYMTPASPAANSNSAGLGKTWFKIWEWSPRWTASTGLIFDSENIWQFNFTIPKNTPNGQYLLRVHQQALNMNERSGEQIALHVAGSAGGAQFYIGCAQLNVVGGGNGSPSPTVSFPGAYSATDPGILLNIYALPTGYSGYQARKDFGVLKSILYLTHDPFTAGPAVWKG